MCFHVAVSKLQCLSHSDDTVYILRAPAHIAFLCTTVNKRLDTFVLPHKHKAHTLRAMELVRPRGNTVYFQATQVVTKMANRLDRIGMKPGVIIMTKLSYPLDVQQVTDLVVGVHQRHHGMRIFF